jgi:phosphonopyruvate decarboxylase
MKAAAFINILKKNGIEDFTGVPCSVFKEVIAYLENNETYWIASNEGESMGIAAGLSLAGKIPAVFMQNDGFGNAINPLTSLQKLYQLPTLLVISWRGEPGVKDAPQHLWSGKTLLDLLRVFEIQHVILDPDHHKSQADVKGLVDHIKRQNQVGAIVCRKGIFTKESVTADHDSQLLSREEAIALITDHVDEETVIFATTGKPSRELYKLKDRANNFYVVGSMGCTSSIAFGFHQVKGGKTVVLDGDGAVLMHMGTLATLAHYQPQQLLHVCLDNESYESTGGQTTVSGSFDLADVARSCGYAQVARVKTDLEIEEFLRSWIQNPRLAFLHIKVRNLTDPQLGRPKESPTLIKERFMDANK